MTAHPVYLYTPGGSFLQTPDGRPLLMQVGYVGTPAEGDGNGTATARVAGAGAAKAARAATAKAPPTFEARTT